MKKLTPEITADELMEAMAAPRRYSFGGQQVAEVFNPIWRLGRGKGKGKVNPGYEVWIQTESGKEAVPMDIRESVIEELIERELIELADREDMDHESTGAPSDLGYTQVVAFQPAGEALLETLATTPLESDAETPAQDPPASEHVQTANAKAEKPVRKHVAAAPSPDPYDDESGDLPLSHRIRHSFVNLGDNLAVVDPEALLEGLSKQGAKGVQFPAETCKDLLMLAAEYDDLLVEQVRKKNALSAINKKVQEHATKMVDMIRHQDPTGTLFDPSV